MLVPGVEVNPVGGVSVQVAPVAWAFGVHVITGAAAPLPSVYVFGEIDRDTNGVGVVVPQVGASTVMVLAVAS